MTARTRTLTATLTPLVLLATLVVPDAFAYNFLTTVSPGGTENPLKWDESSFPVHFFVNNQSPLDFSLETAVEGIRTSFQIWEDVETADITFEFAGLTASESFEFFDDQSTLGFRSDSDLEGTGVLGATLQVINVFSGEIVEADILFSNFFVWTVHPEENPGAFDFLSVATHEIGHFVGLDHSHVGVAESRGFGRRPVEGSAIMYPFSFGPGTDIGRFLTADDVAGVSLLYPVAGFQRSTGAIEGRVTKGGQGVGFAHVVAYNPFADRTIGVFADETGEYIIEGLSPGPHILRVNPITDPASPPDFGFSENAVDLDFRDALFEGGSAQVVAGETTSGIVIEVQP